MEKMLMLIIKIYLACRRPGGELVSVNQILSVKWRNPLREVLSSRHRESNPLREIFSRRAGCRRVAKSSGPRHSQASGRGAGGAAGAGGHTDRVRAGHTDRVRASCKLK